MLVKKRQIFKTQLQINDYLTPSLNFSERYTYTLFSFSTGIQITSQKYIYYRDTETLCSDLRLHTYNK